MPSLSICICSANRASVLERCLSSIAAGSMLPEAVIVSDDSAHGRETRVLCERFGFVQYIEGPRRGLCANRNAVIAHAVTDYISLIDDDGIVGPTFVEDLRKILCSLPPKTVVSGDVLEYGGRTSPSNPWFLGHFGKPYGAEPLQGINLNCNCLPRSAFDTAAFDEGLRYGYEDMDLCSNLSAQGYRFVHDSGLLNEHKPPPQTAEFKRQRYRWSQRARFQTSLLRYLVWQNKPTLACVYLVAAPVHRVMYALRHGLWMDIGYTMRDIVFATRQAVGVRLRNH